MIINNFVPSQGIFNNSLTGKENNLKEISGNSFQDIFKVSLDKLNENQIDANNITNEFVSGGDVEVHEMILSMEEAKMSLELAIQVRNKVVDAVKELTNMQL